ncbi:MAG TPA: Tm-1-like ATP-binding domain-containing protein [Thermodesulfobacteriota bacterium]|nr:Tm-1-like ATP-binding domain-containing protein [Thermodesulfobacteriota bacterium]
MKTILMIGAFDVKGEEFAYVRKLIRNQGFDVLAMDFGVFETTNLFPVDIGHEEVARAGGADLARLQKEKDRGAAMKAMAAGVAALTRRLYDEKRFDAVLGMGGSGGTGIITGGMRTLPIGVPKVMVSTVASGDTSFFVGLKDITMIPSIVDVAGVNRISEKIFTQAAGAICGMVSIEPPRAGEQKPIITATMFGQTTPVVNRCRDLLLEKGFEVLIFHASGAGGRTMESMVEEGLVSAVLDITTTEWADEIGGGILSAGPARLDAPGKAGVPHLIVPGCIDMVNFGPPETVPEKYRDRKFYRSKPTTTLMRTNVEENAKMGEIFAKKANAARGKVAFLFPLKGFSVVDSEGQPFWWPEADRAFMAAVKKNLRPEINVVEIDCQINDEAFARKSVEMILRLMGKEHAG